MKTLAALALVLLSVVGCKKPQQEHIDETVATSQETLRWCNKAAGQSYDIAQATAAAMKTYADSRAEDLASRQQFAASLALCEQQHTNRLLEIQLQRK